MQASIYIDDSMMGAVVVELAGDWWAVPRIPGGWKFRSPYRLDPSMRPLRLKPAPARQAEGLAIPGLHVPRVDDGALELVGQRGRIKGAIL